MLPSGTWVVIPGGVAEQITWTPKVEREGGEGNQSGGSFVTFAPGDPGSCGRVANVGGSFWTSPIDNYQFMRGFSSWHTGVDLAASPGTAVKAANGGVVIFAGWNSWGYGNTIVLSHGPFSTLYGHLSSINVGCGQTVSAGRLLAESALQAIHPARTCISRFAIWMCRRIQPQHCRSRRIANSG